MTEREEIEGAREALRSLEKHLRNIRKINEEAGAIRCPMPSLVLRVK